MGNIHVNVPAIPKSILYGPYDVTDYATWQTDLASNVSAGSKLTYVIKQTKIIFTEVTSS